MISNFREMLNCRSQGLLRARTAAFTLTNTKFTAPTVQEAVKKRYQLDTINYPNPAKVKFPEVRF